MPCTDLTRQDTAARTAARAATPAAGALFPPPGFPAGGHGDTRRRAFPVPAPTGAPFAHDDEESPPGGRGAWLAGPANDIAALIAVALFVGTLGVILAGLSGGA